MLLSGSQENLLTRLYLALIVVFISRSAVAQDVPSIEEIRSVIQKSIGYIESDGEKWIKTKKCNSCHVIPFMLWSLHEAEARGFELNSKRLAELDDWSATDIQPKPDEKMPPKGSETQAKLLVVRASYDGQLNEQFQKMLDRVVEAQQDSGQWEAGGQLPTQKRPLKETEEVSTMWNLLALKKSGLAAKQRMPIEESALKSLSESEIAREAGAKSSEWFAMRLLLAVSGEDGEAIEEARNKLLALQHEDGGWGWLNEEASDALATGTALYALAQSGLSLQDSAMTLAARFLIKAQEEDGTWKSPSTRARDKGKVKPTTIYWATTWSVIGLAQLVPSDDQAE